MGKALYRKYRSKNLSEVVGQKHITDTLQKALDRGAISHAYLFTGPRGVGKTSVARILAHEINNLPYDEESTHLDIIEIDAASNRRIDEIRDLRDKVQIAPTSAKYKVYIIDEVHMLTREAFNALLKTLEEPPEHAVFILATTEAHKVPDTISSRTQQYSFKPITVEDAVLHLRMIADRENLDITDKALELIAKHSDGSFRDSISMLDQISGLSEQTIDDANVALLLGIPQTELLEQIIESIQTADISLVFASLQKLREYGVAPAQLAQYLISHLRNQLIDDKLTLSVRQAVHLMKQLLPYTGAQSSYEALEIILLESVNFREISPENNTSSPVNKASAHSALEASAHTHITKEQPSKIIEDKPKTVLSPNEQKDWQHVLQALKAKHNTLYGVLRMADAQIEGDKITLTFTFEFHRKQIKQNKNLDVLHGVILDTFGRKHEIELLVKKTAEKSAEQKPHPSINVIASVSNIFDGAELLES